MNRLDIGFKKAAEQGNYQAAKAMIDPLEQPRDQAGLNEALFWTASACGDCPDIIAALLNKGAETEFSDCASEGATSLLVAARKGYLKTLQVLANREANLDACDVFGNNALHFAASAGQSVSAAFFVLRVPDLLLQQNRTAAGEHFFPDEWAQHHGHSGLAQYLLEQRLAHTPQTA
jgi:ankyrin repeat protein